MKILRNLLWDTKIDFMRFHKPALVLSVIFILISTSLVFIKGLNFGIDFAGGVLVEARIKDAQITQVREILSQKIHGVQIQNSGQDDFLIRVTKESQGENGEDKKSQVSEIKQIQDVLGANFKNVEYRKVDYVGPQMGPELILKGLLSLFGSFAFIMIYIWIRFDWQFGLGGIFALLHDAFLVMGFYAVTQIEFNLTSIAAILTVIGYSINDSVVIYDRIRENLRKTKKADLTDLINSSINSTLSRTIITSGVTMLSILALVIYGGETLKSFSTAALFGIIVGTYSSIYISAPILLYLDPRSKKKE